MTGVSSPGISTATMIVFFEVSIPRWISPAGDATPDMTAGSFRRNGSGTGVLAPSSFRPTRDFSQQAYGPAHREPPLHTDS